MICASIDTVMTLMQTERAFTEFKLCMHMRGHQFEHYR